MFRQAGSISRSDITHGVGVVTFETKKEAQLAICIFNLIFSNV